MGEQASGDGRTGGLIRPHALYRGRDRWGVVHYGLLFEWPPTAYVVRSAVGTRLEGLPTRRAEVGRWRLDEVGGMAVLFLPRRWLIASGRLSALATLLPWWSFRVSPRVRDEFWLQPGTGA